MFLLQAIIDLFVEVRMTVTEITKDLKDCANFRDTNNHGNQLFINALILDLSLTGISKCQVKQQTATGIVGI